VATPDNNAALSSFDFTRHKPCFEHDEMRARRLPDTP
jgi:hypothetical protein